MMPIVEEIRCALFELSDPSYRKFHQKLIPNVDPERVIGVRMPALRKFAKEKAKDPEIDDFIRSLPHEYYEENNVHAEIIALIKDYDLLIEALDAFLPYVDNWATCDSLKPKLFKKRPRGLTDDARRWMRSEHPYTIRYGIGVLMTYYLDDEFERYCTCEDYYQPVVEDFEFDYYLEKWCEKNGFEIVSYEGDGHDDGYEPSFTRPFYY